MKNDLAGFHRSLKHLAGSIAPIVAHELAAGAEEIAQEIHDNAPVATGLTRDSVRVEPVVNLDGHLETSIVIDRFGDDHIVRFTEYGTAHQEANPFIRRSLAAKREEVSLQILRRTASGIEKING